MFVRQTHTSSPPPDQTHFSRDVAVADQAIHRNQQHKANNYEHNLKTRDEFRVCSNTQCQIKDCRKL